MLGTLVGVIGAAGAGGAADTQDGDIPVVQSLTAIQLALFS